MTMPASELGSHNLGQRIRLQRPSDQTQICGTLASIRHKASESDPRAINTQLRLDVWGNVIRLDLVSTDNTMVTAYGE